MLTSVSDYLILVQLSLGNLMTGRDYKKPRTITLLVYIRKNEPKRHRVEVEVNLIQYNISAGHYQPSSGIKKKYKILPTQLHF